MSSERRPTTRQPPGDLLGSFWPTLASPLATETGSVAALVTAAIPGTAIGLLALVVLALVMPQVRPPDGIVRIAIVLAGPPLRYILLLIAGGKTWLDPADGPLKALLLVLVLAFLVPMVGFLIMQARVRNGR